MLPSIDRSPGDGGDQQKIPVYGVVPGNGEKSQMIPGKCGEPQKIPGDGGETHNYDT